MEFDELPEWIGVESDQTFSKLHSHIRQKYDEVNTILEDIRESRDRLTDAKFGEKVYVRMAKAGASNRDNMVKNLNIIMERITVPGESDPSIASEFYTNAKSTLKNSLENTIRSQQYVKRLFPEEYKSVLLNLKNLDTVLDELMLPIKDGRDKLEAYKRLPDEIEIINKTSRQIEDKKRNISELEKKYALLKNDLPGLEHELKELEKSTGYLKAQELEKDIEYLENKISEIDATIKEQFAPLSKTLSRMEKQDESGRYTLTAGNRQILQLLKNDPVSAVNNDITPFLIEIKSRVEEGSLGLKEQKKYKTLDQIHKLLETDTISSMKKEKNVLLSEHEILMNELSQLNVYQKRTQLDKKVADHISELNKTEGMLETERQGLTELVDNVSKSKEILQFNLNFIFEKEIEVIYK